MAVDGMGANEALVEAARALRPLIRAEAAEIERGRRLTPAVFDALRAAGCFRMVMPRAWGGPEADPLTQIRVVEELSIADGSTGWCAMIGSDAGYYTAFLDDAAGRAMYPDLDLVTAGSMRPSGRAVAVAGGYSVSGRWMFGSACRHSAWLASGCVVYDGEAPRQGPNGRPVTLTCLVPAEQAEILDTWYPTGLRGTGSEDYQVEETFVPSERAFNPLTSPIRRDGPLYAFRTMYLINGVGVPLGIARGALEALLELAQHKVNRFGHNIRDEAQVHLAVARADALISAARGYVFEAVGDLWETLVRGEQPSLRQRARYRLCQPAATEMCTQAVDLLYQAGGSASLYAPHPLDRALRDIHTVGQHAQFAPRSTEEAGRMLLGLEPELPGF